MALRELTHRRDQALVALHQRHDLHCRAAGIQLLLLEYVWGVPKAVIEYRLWTDGVPNYQQAIYRAIGELAGELPFYVVYYTTTPYYGFYVFPVNRVARVKLGNRGYRLSEAAYVDWLHKIRDGIQHVPPKGEYTLPVLDTVTPSRAPDREALVPHLLSLDSAFFPGHAISVRRRRWGDNTPCVDIDFLLIDQNTAKSVAMVEFKQVFEGTVPLGNTNIGSQRLFAAAAGVPFAVVKYWRDPAWHFQPLLIQDRRGVLATPPFPIRSEHEWIARLTALRRRATG
jgi:hypothetical protein